MKFALLIYPKPGSHEELSRDEYEPVNAEYLALPEDPRCVGGAHLQPAETATTVRHSPGQTLITDGLTTEEIARAFLVSAETMKRRLSRAKAKIKATGSRSQCPPTASWRIGCRRCWQ